MSIGTTLLDARLEAHRSLDDIAAATRIRASLIRHIEADNFEPCGGAIYARGHIRSIANALGIDPVPLVAEFNVLQGPPAGLAAHQILDRPEIVQRTPNGPNWTAAMLVTAIVLAGVAMVSLFTNPKGPAPSTAATAPTTAPAVVPRPKASAPALADGQPAAGALANGQPSDAQPSDAQPSGAQPSGAPSDSGAPAAASNPAASPPAKPASQASNSSPAAVVAFNGVSVKVTVTGARCWVRATDLSNTKKILYQGVLERGAVQDFTVTGKISLTFGDAGAVGLTVNGHDLGTPGGPGKVVTVAFGPGDPGAG